MNFRSASRIVREKYFHVPFIDSAADFCLTVALAVNLLVIVGFRADGGLFSAKRMRCVNMVETHVECVENVPSKSTDR